MLRPVAAVLLAGMTWLSWSSAVPARAAESAPLKVPLIVGLVTVGAVHEPDRGDYESILKVQEVTNDGVGYTVSGNVGDDRFTVRRSVKRQDMVHAHEWRPRYKEGDQEVYQGTTGGTLSSDVLNDLKTRGRTSLKVSIGEDPLEGMLKGILGDSAGAFGKLTGRSRGDGKDEGILSRVEAQAVPLSILVNDVRVDLPAVHARGKIGDDPIEVFILDDPAIPLVLRWTLGGINKRMISIAYPIANAASAIEDKLSTTGRAEVYGIYFDFDKATIRPESEPVLKAIADVMSKNPAWKVSVEGHTDNIGSAASNQALSTRRAAAVRQALVDRYHLTANRLAPAGFGASRPKDTNDTLEGRARNRRVELVRQ